MSFSNFQSANVSGLNLKKFESQNEIDEKKRVRQEEWEKVRKPDEPEECPEVPVDNRCLYDKLEEQRLKKQEEFDEKVAFKNQVKRLDADETDFLDFCVERQQEINNERQQEAETIISEMKDVVAVKPLPTKPQDKKRVATVQSGKRSQMALLAGAVKRKGSEDAAVPTKKSKSEHICKPNATSSHRSDDEPLTEIAENIDKLTESKKTVHARSSPQVARVIGILPAATQTAYEDSSDSISTSSDSETEFSISAQKNAVLLMRMQENIQNQMCAE